jgi:outer membrane protein assembly factor BamD (BamD/ComL family)
MIAPPQEPPSGQRPAEQPGQEGQSARLQEAQRLLDNDRYEEAIEAFQKVEGPEQSAQARKGIQEAQDRYAEKRRREAAALVLKAREEGGANRKANLVKALEILQDANKRYPNNRYAPKIDQNIQDVVGQVRAIDPSFRP